MKKKNFDELMYDVNMAALKQLCDNAKRLAGHWYRLNKSLLDSDVYRQWLSDVDLIYKTYENENRERIGDLVWNSLPEKSRRPDLDVDKNAPLFYRIFQTAGMYAGSIYPVNIFIHIGYIDWKDGQPEISNDTMNRVNEECTFVASDKDETILAVLQQYTNAYNQAVELTGQTKFPIRYDEGKANVDVSSYFRNFRQAIK